ncbi:MAG: M13 family metallopeptidase [Ignavibacteriae bacterium]|nr:M13 family metallopeptidase [Ignavibacteria bacterium]MBI3363483.1 M13 family metallopeptidase [Ignavibacteriota bacterium]
MKTHILSFALVAVMAFSASVAVSQTGGTTQALDPLVSHIDPTVKPGDDFFLFANGKWFKDNPIPPSEQSNGLWQLIQDTINAQVRDICESSSSLTTAEKGSNKQKIGDFFFTGMDSVALNNNGIAGLKSDLAMIDGITDLKGLARSAAYIHGVSGSPLFGFGVGQDDKISSKNAIFISQGGLSLPDRRYYFDGDAHAVMIRQKFVEHLHRMFVIMGYDDAGAGQAAERMMKLETAIAQSCRKREDTRDPLKNYNKISFKQLTESTPNLDWSIFAEGVGLHDPDTVVVGQPEFLTALNDELKTFSLDDWKNYLKYHLVRGLARYLDDKTFLETFSFYSTTLRGVPEPKPRWKRVVEQTDGSLGELIGQVYVADYLPKGTKEKLLEIGNAIKDVYAERIKTLDWMSDATKVKALKKLGTIIMKVGYPDKWKDMSSMHVDRSSYVQNGKSANRWRFDYMIAKYGKPVDRTEWGMEPQTYNAYYNPSNNEIVVPGCNIIVPGYERKLADDALLYSIIGGSTFGHEITHGFDDQGSKYDEQGNLNNWWDPDDSAKFYAKTKMIVKQFNEYVAVDTLHINGELTQGENIADLGGIMMGYEAFKKTNQYKSQEVVGDLRPPQRFFLGYALAWMVNERPEAVANQVRSNEHSPVKFRVIGPLSDMPEFYAAFGIKEGDAMWRADNVRVKIW